MEPKKFKRMVVRLGSMSRAIVIPADICNYYNIEVGDEVTVSIDPKTFEINVARECEEKITT